MLNEKHTPIDTITAGHHVLAKALKYRPSGVIIAAVLLSAYTFQCMVNLAIFSCLFSLNKSIVSIDRNGKAQVKQMKEFSDFTVRSAKDRADIRNLLQKHIKADK